MIRRTCEQALARRRKTQKGHEMIEFGILAALIIPLFGGMFYAGLGLIRANQANQLGRDINSLYIKNVDFTTTQGQALAVKMAGGLGLQAPTGGSGEVILTQVTYIGATTGAVCTSVPAGNTCNSNKFVYTQRIIIGDTSLGFTSDFGNPTAPVTGGNVQNYSYNPGAVLPPAQQAAFAALWTTPLQEGQYVYITETFFNPLNAGGSPVHTRSFF